MTSSIDVAVGAFREAVFRPQEWPDALDKVAVSFGAAIVTIVNCTTEGELTCSRRGREAIDRYLHDRDIPDSRQTRVNPELHEGFRTDYDDFDPHEIARDPYYQEFLAPLGLRWHAVAALPGFDERLVISFKRMSDSSAFTPEDVTALNRALPSFRVAARHAALLSRARFDGELTAFSRLGIGALYVDDGGRIIGHNDCVGFGDGIGAPRRRLVAAGAADRAALEQALHAACHPAPATPAAPGPIVVRRPSGRRPYLVDVIAVPAGDLASFERMRALVVINDLDRSASLRRESVARSFALTERETDLAMRLAAGATLRDAALALGITEGHARQRLKSVMEKTLTTRQSELLALLARMR